MRSIAALALSLLLACDADEAPRADPTASAKPTASAPTSAKKPGEPESKYPAGPWEPVRDATVRGPVKDGIVTVTRPLISKLTVNDPIGVAIRFEGEGGPFPTGDATGRRSIDWSASLEKMKFVLSVDGAEQVLEVASKPTASDVSPIGQRARVFHLDERGLEQFAAVTKWKTPPKSRAGMLTLKIRGELLVDGAWIAFESAEMKLERVEAGAAVLPLDNLEGIAARLVEKTERLKKKPSTLGHAVDDTSDNRLFRFRLDEEAPGYDLHLVDVAVSPAGAVTAARRFKHFTCVAANTAIATPRGDVAVQALAIGDEVWAYDTERREKVETRVTAVLESERSRLVSLGGLRVTGEHPIWADGGWVPAREVAAGAVLLTSELSPRTLSAIESIEEPARVYDVSVGHPHNYFAGGVLVHNKAVNVPLAPPGDPWQGLFFRGKTKP